MQLLDSRRLTGPNLLWQHPGAVIDVSYGNCNPDLLIGAWQLQVRRLLDEVDWSEEKTCVRRFRGGASLAISAPIDALYAAAEINEAAWDAVRDFVGGGNRQLLKRVASHLREEIRDEERPRLRRLMAAADANDVPVTVDTAAVSLGLGCRSETWDLRDVPHPDDVDWKRLGRIPLALVTGTNGKTTTVRLLSAIGHAAGLCTGISSTDWLSVGDEILERDDYAGPEGARRVLRDRRTELAILETARGGLLRRGLAVNHADAALITNIASDHIGEFGVQNLDELADVKWIVTRALDQQGRLVLNADDPHLVKRAPRCSAPLIWFSANSKNQVIKEHVAAGGTACTVQRNRVVLIERGCVVPVVPVKSVPITFDGAAHHNVANALGATALSFALGVAVKDIANGLCSLGIEDNPGRTNLYRVDGKTILLDFAHNPHGLQAVIELARALPARRRLLVIGQAGDRSDEDILDFGRVAASLDFDRILIKRLDGYARGRAKGEVAGMLRQELRRQGIAASKLAQHGKEMGAVKAALRWAKAGDLIVLLSHEARDSVMDHLARLQSKSTEMPD